MYLFLFVCVRVRVTPELRRHILIKEINERKIGQSTPRAVDLRQTQCCIKLDFLSKFNKVNIQRTMVALVRVRRETDFGIECSKMLSISEQFPRATLSRPLAFRQVSTATCRKKRSPECTLKVGNGKLAAAVTERTSVDYKIQSCVYSISASFNSCAGVNNVFNSAPISKRGAFR